MARRTHSVRQDGPVLRLTLLRATHRPTDPVDAEPAARRRDGDPSDRHGRHGTHLPRPISGRCLRPGWHVDRAPQGSTGLGAMDPSPMGLAPQLGLFGTSRPSRRRRRLAGSPRRIANAYAESSVLPASFRRSLDASARVGGAPCAVSDLHHRVRPADDPPSGTGNPSGPMDPTPAGPEVPPVVGLLTPGAPFHRTQTHA